MARDYAWHEVISIADSRFTERFELNRKGRLVWLQRACFWLLDKLKARSYETSTVYQLRHRQCTNLAELILNQTKTHGALWYGEKLRYVVGPEVAPELGELMVHQHYRPASFDADVELFQGSTVRVYGVNVTVVPWLKDQAFAIPTSVQ